MSGSLTKPERRRGQGSSMSMFCITHSRHRGPAGAALLLATALIAAPANAQSSQKGVYETPPNEPLYQRPRGNDQYLFQSPGYGEQGYGQGNSLGYGPGYGRDQRQGYGRPWTFEDRRAYSGQPGFGYHQPLGYSPHGGRGSYPAHGGHVPQPGRSGYSAEPWTNGRNPYPVK
jgi:hypothetical protein